MTPRMKNQDKPITIVVVGSEEYEDGSATYTFDLDKDAVQELSQIGLQFTLYCAAYELDIDYVLDNLGRMKQDAE